LNVRNVVASGKSTLVLEIGKVDEDRIDLLLVSKVVAEEP
jgi:hypothetical protein